MDGKNKDALSMRGSLELKRGEWGKAKETFKSIQQADGNDDTYAALSLVSGWQRGGMNQTLADLILCFGGCWGKDPLLTKSGVW